MALNRLRPYPNLLRGPHIPDEEMDAMDFGNYSRQRNSAGIQRSEPRRANFITLSGPSQPPLQRQFAMTEGDHGVFEYVAQLIARGLPQQVPEEPKVSYEFVLQQMEVKEEDWVCSICLDSAEENTDKTCIHPAECHRFHNACLQRWLERTPTCPSCRAAVTPMLARPKP
jgi:hypothetical protein